MPTKAQFERSNLDEFAEDATIINDNVTRANSSLY